MSSRSRHLHPPHRAEDFPAPGDLNIPDRAVSATARSDRITDGWTGRDRTAAPDSETSGSNNGNRLRQTLATLARQRETLAAMPAGDRLLAVLDKAIGELSDFLKADGGYPQDGRYGFDGRNLHMELRVDRAGSGIVSGDLHAEADGTREYLASFRTAPGQSPASEAAIFELVAQDCAGGRSRARLELAGSEHDGLHARIVFLSGLRHLPARQPLALVGRRISHHLRDLAVEMNFESGMDRAIEYRDDVGSLVTIESCFAEAGIAISRRDIADEIPPPAGNGWHDGDLHDLMLRYGEGEFDREDWSLQLLLLRKSVASRLLGVMFDTGRADSNNLPRQGVAVFREPVERHPLRDKKLLQTTLHELGHALNLAHRFERAVGRADSTSIMTYDWRYLGGGNVDRFWRDFDFRFDPDELAFLRHGPRPAVIPGGAEFHTVPYWENTDGGYVPYKPDVPGSDLSLTILPPNNGGLFAFAQPVMLTLALTNRSSRPIAVPWYMLDPKAGFLELVVQRRDGRTGGGNARVFRPIAHRCYDISPRTMTADRLNPGGTLTNNVNLFFGSAGFTFAEPAEYAVTAVLGLNGSDGRSRTYRSQPYRFRVGYPERRDDERQALDLMRWDVGHYVAMGGSRVLHDAREILKKVRRDRRGRKPQISDPLAAALTRARALELARPVPVFRDGRYSMKPGNPQRAAALLESIATIGERVFDPYTNKEMQKLHHKLRSASLPVDS